MSGASGDDGGREYLIEFIEIGQAVRVAAIDTETGEEVVIQAPKTASREDMKRLAVAKLNRKLGISPVRAHKKKRPGETPGRGIIV